METLVKENPSLKSTFQMFIIWIPTLPKHHNCDYILTVDILINGSCWHPAPGDQSLCCADVPGMTEFSAWCQVPRRHKFLSGTNVLSAALTARIKARICSKPGDSKNGGIITKPQFLMQVGTDFRLLLISLINPCSGFLGAHEAGERGVDCLVVVSG